MVTHGTSIAVPHVAGVASLLWEKDFTKSNEFIRQLINFSSQKMEGVTECGLLDAEYALEIYDDFSQNFKDGELKDENVIPENIKTPETFDYVEEDEAYVEGRWHRKGHEDVVGEGQGAGFSDAEIEIIKAGAVFPDGEIKGWGGSKKNPWWHGRWIHPDGVSEVNYVAAVEMITEIALGGGNDISSYTDYKHFYGMSSAVFKEIKADLLYLNTIFDELLPNMNTKTNRKYFMYGCGLHTLTDIFAHSTTTGTGKLIEHNKENYSIHADNTKYYHRRYDVAVKATLYSMKMLSEDNLTDGLEIIQALKKEYQDASYKIIKIKKYVNENGYSDSILSQVTISSPK